MASSQSIAPKYIACDVASFSDSELDRDLEENRLAGGGNGSSRSRIQRICRVFHSATEAIDRVHQTSDIDQSRLLDISSDHLTARARMKLRRVSPETALLVGTTFGTLRRGIPTPIPNYTEAVKKFLAEYSFTRPFQFHEDPAQQDKSTTWLEYLGHECWVHCRFASRVKCMQPKCDAAWKTLVDSSVLRPFETEEHVCNIQSAWALEQVPLIEAEESGRAAARGIKRRFGHDEDDEVTHDRKIKKQRRDAGELGPTPGRKNGPSSQGAKAKRSRDDAAGDGPPSKRFKRGGEHLGFAGSAGDSHKSGSVKIGSPDGGDERAVRTVNRPNRKGSKPSSDHLQRRKGIH
ncbi:hypothetical protein VM1G_11896 [Cytospora mali]|uniref:Uncharacterized protein n=1 Tax=Cytospora mali TaxID=578113 RepID=A0A194WAC6_CYTMA|nr:hypothetical protein VM1G_11896 [Valsa mali]